ncbi:hypothetical protein DL93DRAFT_2103759, partial [Clavulina sp. PMI_390]
ADGVILLHMFFASLEACQRFPKRAATYSPPPITPEFLQAREEFLRNFNVFSLQDLNVISFSLQGVYEPVIEPLKAWATWKNIACQFCGFTSETLRKDSLKRHEENCKQRPQK